MKHKRKHARVEVERNVDILLSDGSRVNAKMNNISNGGIGILYPISTDIGTQLNILFSLPAEQGSVSIITKVTVVYNHYSHNNFQIGLEFIQLEDEDKNSVSKFIHSKLVQKKQTQNFIVVNK